MQETDIIPIIEAAVDAVHPAAKEKQINLNAVLTADAGLVAGDPQRLQQVVWNLLANAIKFTSNGGSVLVELRRVNSRVEIKITDTGQGIAPEFLPFVFERFRQADSSTGGAHGGFGLGLYIVRQIVELCGGTVSAYSGGVSRGATFIVQLPLIDSSGVRAIPESPHEQ